MDKLKHYQQELKNGWIHNSMRNDWKWCPRYFKLRYIDGTKTEPNEVMLLGTYFHDFASFYHELFDIYNLEEFTRLSELIAWQLSFIPENVMPILKIYIERFIVFECRRYWYYCRTLARADEEFIPKYTELTIRHRYGDEQYGRAGTIDAVFQIYDRGNITLRLREYKVSRQTTRNSKFIGTVRGQLVFYKDLLTRLEFAGEDMSFKFELYNPLMDTGVFPLETGTFDRTRSGVYAPYWFYEHPLQASQTALNKSVGYFIEALESEYFPKVPKKSINYKCVQYCGFYGICWGKY